MKNNKTQSSFEIILDHHIKSNDNDIIIEIEDN